MAGIKFISIILSGLIAGIVLGIWVGTDPHSLSPPAYVEQQQNAIKALNVLMPVVGLITFIVTLISAFKQKNNKPVFISLLVAAGLLLVSGLITHFGNQPINAIVMTWSVNNIPNNWADLRDQWWSFHIIRTILCLCAFSIITWVGIKRS